MAKGITFQDGKRVIVDIDPRAHVPKIVSRFQLKTAMMRQDVYTSAAQAADAIGPEAKLAWDEATQFELEGGFIADLANEMGLTETQVDDLFIEAEGITP